MALVSFSGSVNAAGNAEASLGTNRVDATDTAADSAQAAVAAVESDVAVLEADGASPTQAHVNDLRVTWDILVPLIAAVVTASAAAQADNSGKVVITIDEATVDTVTKLQKIFNAAKVAALGSGQLTP